MEELQRERPELELTLNGGAAWRKLAKFCRSIYAQESPLAADHGPNGPFLHIEYWVGWDLEAS